jgi:hypothetical protein
MSQEQMRDSETRDAYLTFLLRAMDARPDLIVPLTEADIEGLDELLEGVEPNLDEDLGDFELP